MIFRLYTNPVITRKRQLMFKPKEFLTKTIVLFLLLYGTVSFAQLKVFTDQPDATYYKGEQMKFVIEADTDGNATYSIRYDKSRAPVIVEGNVSVTNGRGEIDYTHNEPGFVYCYVTLNGQKSLAGAAFSPFDIDEFEEDPDDFDEFWQRWKDKLRAIPMDPDVKPLFPDPSSHTNDFRVNLGQLDGRRIYGYLSIPNGDGPFPAIIQHASFGGNANLCIPRPEISRNVGAITLSMWMHNAEPDIGDNDAYEPEVWDDAENIYYRYGVLGIIRAMDFIETLPEYDGENLGLFGVSEGGGLSILAAGIDDRPTMLGCSIFALSEHTGYKYDRASSFPYFLSRGSINWPPEVDPNVVVASKYYDAMRAAKRYKGPVYSATNYLDETVLSATNFSTFNQFRGPAVIAHKPDGVHISPPEYLFGKFNFMRKHLNQGGETGYFPDAGNDIFNVNGTASLSGKIEFNGVENTSIPVVWELVSGPGQADFSNQTAHQTNVSFSAPGEYLIRFRGTDKSVLDATGSYFTMIDHIIVSSSTAGDLCAAAGGDADNDGYCADDDCDDNNASISQPGDACDDGNPLTENDIINANCNCQGLEICTDAVAGDEAPGCVPCGIDFTLPDGSVISGIDAVGFYSPDYTPDVTNYDFPCGTIEQGAWFTYFANDTGAVAFTFLQNLCADSFSLDLPSNVDVGIYDEDLNLITCAIVDSIFQYSGLAPNQKIRILLDGTPDKTCAIILLMQYPRIAKAIKPISIINSSTETDAFCITEEVCFSVDADIAVTNYKWEVPSSAEVLSGGGPFDNEMCVRFERTGQDMVSVTPSNPCNQGAKVVRSFGVYDINAPFGNFDGPPNTVLCHGDEICLDFDPTDFSVDYEWFVSSDFDIKSGGGNSEDNICVKLVDSEDGTALISVRPLDGCNQSVINFTTLPEIPTTVLPEVRVCEENYPIEIEGETFQGPGVYAVTKTSLNGCDSILRIDIKTDVSDTGTFSGAICPEDLCVQIGDSCYDISSQMAVIDRPFPLCDSMVILDPIINELTSISCTEKENSLVFNWRLLELADRYAININGTLDTITTNQFETDQLTSDSIITLIVQPIGSCEFPEQISVTCNFGYVGNKNRYLDSKIKVLPNPSDNEVFLETDLTIESVEIYDLAGRLIEQKNANSFSLKKYGSGLYIFRIKTEEGVGVKRVVIQ